MNINLIVLQINWLGKTNLGLIYWSLIKFYLFWLRSMKSNNIKDVTFMIILPSFENGWVGVILQGKLNKAGTIYKNDNISDSNNDC